MGQIEEWTKLNERFSLIPLNGKVPIELDWTKWCFQKRPFDPKEFEGRNAGIACGPASGIIVIDIDTPTRFRILKEEQKWIIPATYTVESRAGRFHLYFEYPNDNGSRYGCKSWVEKIDGTKTTIFDVRGLGGQVVAPFSKHPDTGREYRVHRDIYIHKCPEWLLEYSRKEPDQPRKIITRSQWDGSIDNLPISADMKSLIFNGTDVGGRSEAIMSVVNALIYANLTEADILSIFDKYPIGDKYREKNSTKEKWLLSHIRKAESYVVDRAEPEVVWEVDKSQQRVTKANIGYQTETQGNIEGNNSENQGNIEETTWSNRGISAIIEGYINDFSDTFCTRDLDEYVKSKMGVDKLPRQYQVARAKTLTRFVDSKKLERTVRGGYRIVDCTLEDMDEGLGEANHRIKLPLGLLSMVSVEPKEVILVGGNTNAGKTCFALHVGLLNKEHTYKEEEKGQGGYGVYHFVSEMGGVSFRSKMGRISDTAYDDYREKVRVLIFNPSSIQDQIQPNSINIIDYLEPALGDFRQIVPTINAIFHKLVTGVALICIQTRGEGFVGGEGVLWKPRLAVSLINDDKRNCKVAKITKGKTSIRDCDIKNWQLDYWTHNKGTKFQELSDWQPPWQAGKKRYVNYL